MKTALGLLLSIPLLAASPQENSFLLRGVNIHPITAPEISNGSLLVLDGKIAAMGPKVAPPKGIRVVEGKGLHLWPGMINSATQAGLIEISAVTESRDLAELGSFNPQLRTLIAVNPSSEHIPVIRANGITSAITVPGGSVIGGQAALIHLDGWTWEEMAVLPSAALCLRFPQITTTAPSQTGPPRRIPYPEARRNYERSLSELREFFENARRYQAAKANPGADFTTDLKLEAMLPVLAGKLPVLIFASREREIAEALAFAEKERIRVILADVQRPGKTLETIKSRKIPVILGNTQELPLEEDDPYDSVYSLPVELHKAGIKFAFGTFDVQFARNLPYQPASAVPFGLPREEALKSLTINAAEIWGVADRIGSIEPGKLADLVLTDGDPLEVRTQVKQMWIAGRQVDLTSRHTRLYEKYSARP